MTREISWKLAAMVAALAAPTAGLAQAKMDKQPGTIVEVAVNAGSFKTLVTALKAAELVPALQAEGPFTVFAPSDAAFAKLPEGTVEGLLKDKQALASVLTFHVVSGKIMAADAIAAKRASPITLNGQELAVEVRDGKVYVNGAQVITADIPASNGVIHVIDAVLIPASAPATSNR